MANGSIEIPFYVARDGQPLTGAAGEMDFESLKLYDGTDKSGSVPVISEVGGGWYKFSVAYGTAPFDGGDLVGVIDADKDGDNGLLDAERYIPVEVRLDYYALMRLVNKVSQDKLTGELSVMDGSDNSILGIGFVEDAEKVVRSPGAGS